VAPALLVIAEIGGFTRRALAGRTARAHAATVGRTLLDVVIEQGVALSLVRLERESALFARRGDLDASAAMMPSILNKAHARYSMRLRELIALRTCFCDFCSNMENLNLGFVAHAGEVAWLHDRRGVELMGRAAALVHAMRRSTVPVANHLLMTDAVRERLDPDVRSRASRIVQDFGGIGPTTTHYLPIPVADKGTPQAGWWRKVMARLALEALALPDRLAPAPITTREGL
jgi:hypothetical protein